jgi:hypothetical protein
VNYQPAGSRALVFFLGINTRTITTALFTVALVWIVVDALLNVAEHGLGYSSLTGLIQVLDLDRERNLATWYASLQLAFAALLLVDAASAERLRGGRHYHRLNLLAFGFCYLSVDEYLSLHERLVPAMQLAVGALLALSAALCSAGWLRDSPPPSGGGC